MKTFPKMHISLYVTNLEATINFYNMLFGRKPSKVENGYTKYELESPALIISFLENPNKIKSGFGHLGFQVSSKDEVLAMMEKVKKEGLSIKEEMGTACCYAIQDKFWVADPDGYQWEIYYFHNDVAYHDPHSQFAVKEERSCCVPSEQTNITKTQPGASCC